jgi:hypothetical protein
MRRATVLATRAPKSRRIRCRPASSPAALPADLAQEDQTLPPTLRFAWNAGYGEGWALYAEWLGHEMGLYAGDLIQHFGRLDGPLRTLPRGRPRPSGSSSREAAPARRPPGTRHRPLRLTCGPADRSAFAPS